MIDVLLDAFLISLLLLGIHAYFGREIIRRGVVFTDLAIAQSASVGIAISIVLHQETLAGVLSLTFALLGGLSIYLLEKKDRYKEAYIGLVYALSISTGFLVLSFSPHGAEDFLRLTAKDILFVPRDKVFLTFLLYSLLGVLILLRERVKTAWLRDILFYLLFAVTVASSVQLVGVLVVFSLLLAPALVSLYLRKGIIFAWLYGSVVNVASIFISYYMDLPTGFSIVFFHTLLALLTVIIFR